MGSSTSKNIQWSSRLGTRILMMPCPSQQVQVAPKRPQVQTHHLPYSHQQTQSTQQNHTSSHPSTDCPLCASRWSRSSRCLFNHLLLNVVRMDQELRRTRIGTRYSRGHHSLGHSQRRRRRQYRQHLHHKHPGHLRRCPSHRQTLLRTRHLRPLLYI